MNKTIEEEVRIAFTNPYSGERQDLSPMTEDDFRTALTKAYEAGQVEALETIIDDIDDRFVWAGDTHATSGGFEYLNKALMELIELIKQRVATLKAKTGTP